MLAALQILQQVSDLIHHGRVPIWNLGGQKPPGRDRLTEDAAQGALQRSGYGRRDPLLLPVQPQGIAVLVAHRPWRSCGWSPKLLGSFASAHDAVVLQCCRELSALPLIPRPLPMLGGLGHGPLFQKLKAT